jgi:hypothetical protein
MTPTENRFNDLTDIHCLAPDKLELLGPGIYVLEVI